MWSLFLEAEIRNIYIYIDPNRMFVALGSGKPHPIILACHRGAFWWLCPSGLGVCDWQVVVCLSTEQLFRWPYGDWLISRFGLFLSGPIQVVSRMPLWALGFERFFSRIGYIRFDLMMRSLLHWRQWIASLCLLAWSMPTTSFTDMLNPLQSLLFRKFYGLVL